MRTKVGRWGGICDPTAGWIPLRKHEAWNSTLGRDEQQWNLGDAWWGSTDHSYGVVTGATHRGSPLRGSECEHSQPGILRADLEIALPREDWEIPAARERELMLSGFSGSFPPQYTHSLPSAHSDLAGWRKLEVRPEI